MGVIILRQNGLGVIILRQNGLGVLMLRQDGWGVIILRWFGRIHTEKGRFGNNNTEMVLENSY